MTRLAPENFATTEAGFLDAPFGRYAALDAAPDLFYSHAEQAWIAHRHALVASLLADRRLAVVELATLIRDLTRLGGREVPDLVSVLSAVLFLRNPPGHTEKRHFLAAVIHDRRSAELMQLADRIGAELIAGWAGGAQIDLARDFADLLPPLFIGRMLGLPDALTLDLVSTMNEVTKVFDRGRSLRFYQRVDATIAAARAPVDALIRSRRTQPQDDGLSRMIALSDSRFGLDPMALGSHVLFLLIAGAETTSALIGNALAAVIDHGLPPAAAPGFAAAWIEETLRHDGPVHQATRIATEDLVLAGQRVARGDRIVLLIGAAHRDARRFAQPEAFRPDRTDQDVLAFGAGLHHCLGAQMARIEAQSAITLLAQRLDRPTRTTSPRDYWQHRTLRRILSLPATVLPAPMKDPSQCQR